MNKEEKIERLNQWTTEYYEESKKVIKNSEILPIVVPSYKRGVNASTFQLLKNYPELNVIAFIYEDEFELYKPLFEQYPHIKYQLCSGFRGIAPKRAYINKRMVELGMNEFFVLDDDATSFAYTIAGHQVKDPTKYKAEKVKIDPQDFFRMFQYIIKYKADRKVTACGIIFDNGAVFQNLKTLPDINYVGGQAFLIYIDAKEALEHGVNYREEHGWEDFDFSVQLLNAGLESCNIRYMTAATPTMTPGDSVASTGELIWGKRSMALYKTWGEYIRFEPKKGELNAKVRWVTIRNHLQKFGKLNITYNPIYLTYVENNDARGLLNYLEAEKEAKKKHSKSKKEKKDARSK